MNEYIANAHIKALEKLVRTLRQEDAGRGIFQELPVLEQSLEIHKYHVKVIKKLEGGS